MIGNDKMKNGRMLVTGGRRLYGEVWPGGSKNSALVCIAAACLSSDGGAVVLKNIPDTSDSHIMCQIVEMLGKKVMFQEDTVTISGSFRCSRVEPAMTEKLRGSQYLLGMLLACMGEADCGFPGGDRIGNRPVDIHVSALSKMGVRFQIMEDVILAKADDRLKGAHIYLRYPSVGATCNVMLAASKAVGKTVIVNAAREPEIVDLSNLLTKMGVRLAGAGTECITIYGTDQIHGNVVHEIIPDRIEAGVLAIAATVAGGDLMVKRSIPYHNFALISLLSAVGAEIHIQEDSVHIRSDGKINAFDASMMPFPGIATDLQPVIAVMATQADGVSSVADLVFPERFQYVKELQRMGVKIERHGSTLKIYGKACLQGSKVTGSDIRAITALICAGLAAEGTTEIKGLHHLYRGYPDLERKLKEAGADIVIE